MNTPMSILEVNSANLWAYYRRYVVPRSAFMVGYYITGAGLLAWTFWPPLRVTWAAVVAIYIAMPCVLLLHEFLHWLAARLMGAKDVRFGWHKWCAYAGPHLFHASFRQQFIITLTPLFAITSLFAFTQALLPDQRLVIGFAATLHWLMCISDATWINCMYALRGKFDYTVCDLDSFTFRLVKEKGSPSSTTLTAAHQPGAPAMP
jgi:hypothetical protein